jgi:hypothetical protein
VPLLRIGVLSAAAINYTAIFDPVSTHPSTIITGLAARSKSRAEAQIAANKRFLPAECKAYGSYEALLEDANIDAVYIPLPNGLHHKWAIAALEKGKHVLIEKPIANNAAEAREIRDVAARVGKVALEAFHWRFHPAAHVLKDVIASGEYGRVLAVHTHAALPAGGVGKDDIRFQYSLGGGCCMDLTYMFSAISCFGATDIGDPDIEFQVLDAKARLNKKDILIDEATSATLTIRDPRPLGAPETSAGLATAVKCTFDADLYQPWILGFIPRLSTPAITVQTEKSEISFTNFVSEHSGISDAFHGCPSVNITLSHNVARKRLTLLRTDGSLVGPFHHHRPRHTLAHGSHTNPHTQHQAEEGPQSVQGRASVGCGWLGRRTARRREMVDHLPLAIGGLCQEDP